MADFKVQIKAVAVGNGTLRHIDANPSIGRLQDTAVRVKDSIGAGYYGTVAVGVQRELSIDATVVVVGSVGVPRWPTILEGLVGLSVPFERKRTFQSNTSAKLINKFKRRFKSKKSNS